MNQLNQEKKEAESLFSKKDVGLLTTPKEYSWIEIVKHDRPGDCWIVIHGKVYDLSEFAKIHPGFLYS